MAVGIVPVNSSAPVFGRSYPNRVSLAFFDDGGGGNLFLNGGGISGVGVYDLKTLFTSVGMLFNSYPLLRAFRQIPNGTNDENCDRILSEIEIVTNQISTATPLANMAVTYNAPTPLNLTWPAIALVGPGIARQWRVDIRLRHSITD